MRRAIAAINSKKVGWLKASKQFNVPQATLRRRYGGKNQICNGVNKKLDRAPIFSPEIEQKIVSHILNLESKLFEITIKELRLLAFELAEGAGIPHNFNRVKKEAGLDWVKGFRLRNKDISLRKPEPTSAARAQAFNKPQVNKYFDLLSTTLEKENISFDKIYNMDESALTTVQKPSKILASKGKKQVGALTSAERGQHVSIVACVSSIGHYIPPALIFPRKKFNALYYDDARPGTLALWQDSGYMTSEIFINWIKHFV